MKKLLAILVCLALVVGCFAGCGQSAGSGTTFRKMYSGEVTTMNYLVTGSTNDLIIPANVIDTLVEYDAYGAIKPALAESWETSEDGLTWTFHLREGVKWYDYTGKEVAPVTAQDFVDAAIYALDAKNASSTEYMMEGIIANATEYYKYTSYLLESENGTKTTDEDGEAIEPVAEVKPEDSGQDAGIYARTAHSVFPVRFELWLLSACKRCIHAELHCRRRYRYVRNRQHQAAL